MSATILCPVCQMEHEPRRCPPEAQRLEVRPLSAYARRELERQRSRTASANGARPLSPQVAPGA